MTGFGDATSDEDADPKGTRLVAIGRVVVEGRGIRAQSAALAQRNKKIAQNYNSYICNTGHTGPSEFCATSI